MRAADWITKWESDAVSINKFIWCAWEVGNCHTTAAAATKKKCTVSFHCKIMWRKAWAQPLITIYTIANMPTSQLINFLLIFFSSFNENSALDAIYGLVQRKKWTVAVYAAETVHRALNHSINGKLHRCHCARWHVVAVSGPIILYIICTFELKWRQETAQKMIET